MLTPWKEGHLFSVGHGAMTVLIVGCKEDIMLVAGDPGQDKAG